MTVAAGVRGSGGVEEDKVLEGEGAGLVEIADDYQKYQQRLLFRSDRTNICLRGCAG